MFPLFSYGDDGSLVAQIGQIGTTEAESQGGNSPGVVVELLLGGKLKFGKIQFENLLPALKIRQINLNNPVKTPRTSQSRIQHLFSIGGRQHNDVIACAEAVHLHQQLVQSVGPLIVGSSELVLSLSSNCVDLVDENDGWSFLFCIIEQLPYSLGAHACEELHELTPTYREEWDLGFSSAGFCQHCLTCAWRTSQQGSLRYLGSYLLILVGFAQEID